MPTTTEEYVELANMLNNDWGKVEGSPQRLAILLGMRGKTEKAVIPSAARNQYSMKKWKFLLDAPFKVSDRCCNVMKKGPAHDYHKKTGRNPITAQMASESRLRTQKWVQHGCNGFNLKIPTSNPMSFWSEQDVLLYIKAQGIPICSVYGDIIEKGQLEGQMTWGNAPQYGIFDMPNIALTTTGCKRTGCMFCGFGCHISGDERFVRMKQTHPKTYEWIMKPWEDGGLGYKEVIDWINEHGNLNIKY